MAVLQIHLMLYFISRSRCMCMRLLPRRDSVSQLHGDDDVVSRPSSESVQPSLNGIDGSVLEVRVLHEYIIDANSWSSTIIVPNEDCRHSWLWVSFFLCTSGVYVRAPVYACVRVHGQSVYILRCARILCVHGRVTGPSVYTVCMRSVLREAAAVCHN